MTRSALPQNYIIKEGTIIEDFSRSLASWVKGGSGTLELNTNYYTDNLGKTAHQSLKFTTTNTVSGVSASSPASSHSLNLLGNPGRTMYIRGYNHEGSNCAGILFTVTSVNSFAKSLMSTFVGMGSRVGEFVVAVPRSAWSSTNGEVWDNTTMIRISTQVIANTDSTAIVSLDSIYTDQISLPRCLITFDDGWRGPVDYAYPYMKARGIKGTYYVCTDWIGDENKPTVAELTAMQNDGWDISSHAVEHEPLSSFTLAQQREKLLTAQNWLRANGFTRGAYHLGYPDGACNADTFAAMRELGILTGRIATGGYQYYPPDDLFQIRGTASPGSTTTLATIKSVIDKAISTEGTLVLYFHDLAETVTETNQWSVANFQATIDYIVAKKLECVTITEWYNGLTNPRRRG